MKTLGVVTISFVLALGLATGEGVRSAEALEYLGDVCWSFAYTNGNSGTVRAGVFHMGGGHYLLGGVGTMTSPQFQQSTLHGNAEFIGSNIELTVLFSDSSSGLAMYNMYHAVLNPLTLSGTFRAAGGENTPTAAYYWYVDGTATHIQCP